MRYPLVAPVRAVFLVLVLAAPVVAWDEPAGFRDLPWGASAETIKEKIPELKCGERNSIGRSSCSGILKIGPVVVTAWLRLLPTGFDSVTLGFPSDSFEALKQIFGERYGQPTDQRSIPVQSRVGARYENIILEWRGEKVVIELRRFGGTLREGGATIMTRASHDEELKKLQEQMQRGKKDL